MFKYWVLFGIFLFLLLIILLNVVFNDEVTFKEVVPAIILCLLVSVPIMVLKIREVKKQV